MHTGEAAPVGGRYVALALHQVARICASAHGGQVLASETTADDVGGRLPSGVGLRALGPFQLRGFPTPVRLFQLRHPGLDEEFPPLRALGVVAHNLPFLRAAFVGRAHDRAAVAALLRSTGVVTVVGLGGVGKTRLAVQVAFDVMADFADGAWLVELASVTDPAAVPRAVAAALRVPEQPGRDLADVVVEWLGPKATLLVLDNCEHVLDAVAGLAERLAQHCPDVEVLATSREPLDIEGEAVWRLDPLPTPDPQGVRRADDASDADAVQLFVQRAALVRPGFALTDDNAADVAGVVSRLNGIPLAIELAAAALRDRPLPALLQGLSDRFALLTYGRRTAPQRHHTLRAALEWSLDLLGADERRLFARLSVFTGGGTVDATAAVCGGAPLDETAVPTLLRRLAHASLLTTDDGTPERWSMLESVRELAAIELRGLGEDGELSARHRGWFADHVERISPSLGRRGREDLMRGLADDHANVRQAIETAVAAADTATALRLCAAMTPFWTSHGDWSEGCERLDAVLALPGGEPALRGRALTALGELLLLRGETAEAGRRFEEARVLVEGGGDDVWLARTLSGLGYVAFRHSQLPEAARAWERALELAERAGDERVTAQTLRSLAIVEGSTGQQGRASDLLQRGVAAAERAQDDQLLRLLLGSVAEVHLWMGEYQRAGDDYVQALELASRIGDLSARPLLLAELGWVSLLRGELPDVQRLAVEAAELAEDLGNRRVLAHALRLEGEALARTGQPDGAAARLERALRVTRELGAPAEIAGVLCSQACLALGERHPDEARRLVEEAISLTPLGHTMRTTSPSWVLGAAALESGDLEAAAGHFSTDLEKAQIGDMPRHEANDLWGLAAVSNASGRSAEAARLHRQALGLRHRIGDRLGVIDSLVGVALLAVADQPATAVRLVGAAETLRSRAGATATPREAAQAAAVLDAVPDDVREVASGPVTDLDEDTAVALATRFAEHVGDG